jgi:hypothetical protein
MGFDPTWLFICVGIATIILMTISMFMTFVVQKKYIIKRFEEETNLLREIRGLYNLITPRLFPISKPITYSVVLFLAMLMNDKIMKMSPGFRGSPSRKEILSHFSKKERILTAVSVGSCFLCLFLVPVWYFISWYWKIG